MKVSLEKPGTPSEIVHYGVKGMKWGVRKSYTDKVDAKAARFRRVAEGRGSAVDKLKTYGTTTNLDLARGLVKGKGYRGFKGAARFRAEDAEAHSARIKAGEATTKDILQMAGHISLADVARGARLAKGK
jgi:hypothetical protein